MAISDFFKNNFETDNRDANAKLHIHYYGSEYYKTQEAVSNLMKKEGFVLLHTDNGRRCLLCTIIFDGFC